MKRFMLFVLIVLSSQTLILAQPDSWQLDGLQPLSSIIEDSENVRYAALSPDGSKLAWVMRDQGICIYTFADASTACHPWPEMYSGFNEYSNLSWSPDSAYLTFTEDLFRLMRDSDIWAIETATGQGLNLTDDSFYGGFLGKDEPYLLDYLPTWNPANGDLYFFRSEQLDEGYSLQLYLLPLSRGEPKLVADLTTHFPNLSIYRAAVISPDGKQMAVTVLSQDWSSPENGIWIIDLRDGSLEQVAVLDDFFGGLPDWVETDSLRLMPETILWANEGSGLVIPASDYQYSALAIQRNVFYIDLKSKTVTPLIDYTDIPDQPSVYSPDDEGYTPADRVPRAGVVLPDGHTYVYLHNGPTSSNRARISALTLPPTGEQADIVATIDPFEIIAAATSVPTSSTDGKALLFGYLLTFKPE